MARDEILSIWSADSDAILDRVAELITDRGDCPEDFWSTRNAELTETDLASVAELAAEDDDGDIRSAVVVVLADRLEAEGLAKYAAGKKAEEEAELAEWVAGNAAYAATVEQLRKIPGFGDLSDRRRSQYVQAASGVSFRVSDHRQKEGGGYLENDGYRAGDSHISVVITARQVTVEVLGDYDREARATIRAKVAQWSDTPTANELYDALRTAVAAATE